MSDRRSYSTQASADAEFSEITVERSLSYLELARSHVIGRNRRLGQLLCYLNLIRAYERVPPQTRCIVVGAGVQDFSSEGGREAAHYLPGQLLLQLPGGTAVEPWKVVQHATTRDAIGMLFSSVQDLPANFNKADSYVEKYARPALKWIFRDACQAALDAPLHAGRTVNAAAVRKAYEGWIVQSQQSYRFAINRKVDIADLDELPPATAPGMVATGLFDPHLLDTRLPDLMERAVRKSKAGKGGATVWDYSEQTRILGHYLRFSEGSTLGDALIRDVQSSFKP
jgi:hypothetical protein